MGALDKHKLKYEQIKPSKPKFRPAKPSRLSWLRTKIKHWFPL